MLIAIPSMARAGTHMHRLFVHKMPKRWQYMTAMFVPKTEWERYNTTLMDLELPVLLIAVPEKVKGIIGTRRWIGEWVNKNKHDKFVMCDDDLLFHTRIRPDDYHLAMSTEQQFGQMFDWIEKTLNKHAQVGISSREGNNRAGNGDVKQLTVLNSRLLRVYAYRTDVFLKMCNPKEVPENFTMDDFHVTLKLLRAGYSNCQTFWWCQDQRYTQDVGGASVYRTFESHNASAELLAKMHPDFVRLHQKDDKSKFGKRTEVVISWKKAYAAGQGLS